MDTQYFKQEIRKTFLLLELAQYLRGRDRDGSANTGGARNPLDQWEAATPEPGRIKYLYTPQNTVEGEG